MSLKSQAICPVPQETARIARAAYPKGSLYMQMRDVLVSIYPRDAQRVRFSVIVTPDRVPSSKQQRLNQ